MTMEPVDVLEQDIERELRDRQRASEAREREEIRARLRAKAEKAARLESAQQRRSDAIARRPQLEADVAVAAERFTEAKAAWARSSAALQAAMSAQVENDQEVSSATAMIESMREDPLRALVDDPTLDGVVALIESLEDAVEGTLGWGNTKFLESDRPKIDALQRAVKKLSAKDRAEVDRLLFERWGLGRRVVPIR